MSLRSDCVINRDRNIAAQNRGVGSVPVKIQSTSQKEQSVIQAGQNTVERDASLILYKYLVTDLVYSNHILGYVQVESKVFDCSLKSVSDLCQVSRANCKSLVKNVYYNYGVLPVLLMDLRISMEMVTGCVVCLHSDFKGMCVYVAGSSK